MKVLVINAGSSTIKYRAFEMEGEKTLARGMVERIGEPRARLIHRAGKSEGIEREVSVPGHRRGMELIVAALTDSSDGVISRASDISAVGHRVVHGGEDFIEPALIDREVLAAIQRNSMLAPLHNPANLAGIEAARALLPGAFQAAVFDTAFHQTMPEKAFRYALPDKLYREHRVRRYGFHGASHQYVAEEAARFLGRPLSELNLITVHLGSGSSMTAVRKGLSIDTSMGMTPLQGLVMGTRCGDVDPAIHLFLAQNLGMSVSEIERMMNKQSGLLGMCGTNDMREVLARVADADPVAELAFKVFIYSIKKYLGAYMAVLGRTDAIVFTAGIGENSAEVRQASLEGLESLGVIIDPARNADPRPGSFQISSDDSRVKVLVIPTNEELAIARKTVELCMRSGG